MSEPLTDEEIRHWQTELTPKRLEQIQELLPDHLADLWLVFERAISDVVRLRAALVAIRALDLSSNQPGKLAAARREIERLSRDVVEGE